MSALLDEDTLVAALGETIGRFLAANAAPDPGDDASGQAGRVQEYLRFLQDHQRLEAHARATANLDLETARKIGEAYRALLHEARGEAAALVVAGLRYFVSPYDAVSELEDRSGFEDDRKVVNYVIDATGSSVAKV